MSGREILPARRMSQTLGFQDRNGQAYAATLGHYPDGRPGEVFLSAGKAGSDLDINLRDAAIAASLALQYGCPPETLRRAFLREADGGPAGPLAQLFDLLAEEIKQGGI